MRSSNGSGIWTGAIATGLGLFLLLRWLDGSLAFYVGPDFVGLVVASALALLVIGAVRLRTVERRHQPVSRWWLGPAVLALPVVIGLVVPVRPLGSAAVADSTAPPDVGLTAPSVLRRSDTASWTLLEWGYARVRDPDLNGYQGQPVALIGFVHRDARLPSDAFYVARFVLRCCTADAAAVTLPVRFVEGTVPARDQWVQVEGLIGQMTLGEERLPAIRADRVTPVPPPSRPYLTP